jgi:hypothetical protein
MSLNLDEVLAQWAKDCEIDHNLESSSRETPKLHAKYLTYYSQTKLLLKRAEEQQQVLLKHKYLWYNGKLSQEEISSLGWEPDPFDGLKIMKGDLDYYYNSDPEIQKSEAKIVYFKTLLDTLKEILETLKWRHQTIGNAIKWRQFEAGS